MEKQILTSFSDHQRTDAMKKYNAVYSVNVVVKNGRLSYERPILGMWDLEKYMSLLMGEIQRLSDNENGYGPKGKNFIEHVEIPAGVKKHMMNCV